MDWQGASVQGRSYNRPYQGGEAVNHQVGLVGSASEFPLKSGLVGRQMVGLWAEEGGPIVGLGGEEGGEEGGGGVIVRGGAYQAEGRRPASVLEENLNWGESGLKREQCSQPSRPDVRALASYSPVRPVRVGGGRPPTASVFFKSRRPVG